MNKLARFIASWDQRIKSSTLLLLVEVNPSFLSAFLSPRQAHCCCSPGLRKVIVSAGFLMAAGCLLRSGIPFVGGLPSYELITLGVHDRSNLCVLTHLLLHHYHCIPPLMAPQTKLPGHFVSSSSERNGVCTTMAWHYFVSTLFCPKSFNPDQNYT